jgi:hypothetical protein
MNQNGAKSTWGISNRLIWLVFGIFLVSFSYKIVRNSWIIPRNSGIAIQAEIDCLFRSREIEGYASVVFYDERVRFFSDSLSLEDAREFVPILRKIEWLRLVDFRQTTLSEEEIAVLKSELEPVVVVGP